MEFSDTGYCKITRCLLKCVGQWPYQNPWQRISRTYTIIVTLCLVFMSQILKAIMSFRDIEVVTATIPPFVTALISFVKLVTFEINAKSVKIFQNEINEHWRNLQDTEEIKIMDKYVSEGKFYVTAYTSYVYMATITFILLLFEPHVLDILVPLNESRPLKTLYPADYYFLKGEEYFYLVSCQMILCCVIAITVLLASDTFSITYVQYTCGIFAIVGYRLENGLYKKFFLEETSPSHLEKLCKRYTVETIKNHRVALRFVDIIGSIFSMSQLIILVLNMICMSVTLVQVVILLGSLEVVRYILYAIGQLFHLFCTSYQGQKLIDHSIQLSNNIYGGTWYNAPRSTQKMLLFLLKRSTAPSYITAGKMFIFSSESFGRVVQTCMSYFMVLASFRE